ncbi:hypothetical protein [Helicobacter cappadocius]|uniref:Highly acidic protein n=1 Tax=Helicobacter cappadocius TaxID=3063998 RepID=A0AA90TBU0_9HELI|nr:MULTISPECIES: hypothetical protein [unclassified Helicobacter]MDO7253212.1 hypothetical protein [Helicobacter sp. faydin-H75]MDP2539136.1 hypothetical protein [Helicobacter sp. faydin-H76]
MLETYTYKMYEDDEIEDEGFDDEYQDCDDEDEVPSYNGYDDDDYQNADEEYEEE